MKKWSERVACFLLIVLTSITLGRFVYASRQVYLTKFDIPKNELVYAHSQYNVPKNEFWGNMDDPELFSLAGYRYISGGDPASINFEQQPLAKYFFGLSILLFGNAVVVQLLFGLSVLGLTYLVAREALFSPVFSLVPVVILSFDPLFREQISRVYLDLFLTLNVLAFFWLFIRSLRNRKLVALTMFWLGLVMLSKSFMFLPLLLATVFIYLGLYEKSPVTRRYFLGLVWTCLAYLGGYVVYFFYHPPWEWVFLHLKTIRLYKSYVPEYPKGEIWRIIFRGQWRRWWGDFSLMPVPTWWTFWPLGVFGLGLSAGFNLMRKQKIITLLCLWTGIWLAANSWKLVFPRYLLPALPFLDILSVWAARQIIVSLSHAYRDQR